MIKDPFRRFILAIQVACEQEARQKVERFDYYNGDGDICESVFLIDAGGDDSTLVLDSMFMVSVTAATVKRHLFTKQMQEATA